MLGHELQIVAIAQRKISKNVGLSDFMSLVVYPEKQAPKHLSSITRLGP